MGSDGRVIGIVALVAAVAIVAIVAGGSSPRAAAPAAETGVVESDGTWQSARSLSGVLIRVRTEPDPPRTGRNRVIITVPAGGAEPSSLDLASPSMPTHGVRRFPIERERARFTASVPVPMEGDWSVYVNLDEGGIDAAEFRWLVPGAGASGHAHGHVADTASSQSGQAAGRGAPATRG